MKTVKCHVFSNGGAIFEMDSDWSAKAAENFVETIRQASKTGWPMLMSAGVRLEIIEHSNPFGDFKPQGENDGDDEEEDGADDGADDGDSGADG